MNEILCTPSIRDLSELIQEINELSNIVTVLENNSKQYELLNSYNKAGTYTIDNLTIGKPLVFGVSTTNSNDTYSVCFRIISGSLIGLSNYKASNTGSFSLGRSSTWISSCSAIVIPTNNSVTFNIQLVNGSTTLYVYH